MNLIDYPRPPNDNRVGVHGPSRQYLDTIGLGTEWDTLWEQRIQNLGVKWFKVMDDGSGSSWLTINRLIDIGVMPVVRLYRERPNPGRINSGNLQFIERCTKIGAVYFETNNEPDLDLEWKGGHRPDNWLDIVVDNFIAEADQVHNAGGILLFPAFGPGGRGNPFEMIMQRGRSDLFKGKIAAAVHNYCLARPLSYPDDPVNQLGQPLTESEWLDVWPDYLGSDGPNKAWEMSYQSVNNFRATLKKPGSTILDDSTCFRAFEYINHLVVQACGHSIPIMMTEGGYNVGQRAGSTFGDDPRYPKPSPLETSQLTMEMFKYDAPDYYFCSMPWLLAVQAVGLGQPNFENQGPWYGWLYKDAFANCDGQLPIVDMMYDYEFPVYQDGPTPPGWGDGDTGGGDKPMTWFTDRDNEAAGYYGATGDILNDAVEYGVKVMLPEANEGDDVWMPIGVFHLPEWENRRNHNIFVSLLDQDGNYLGPLPRAVRFEWEGMRPEETPQPVELKAEPERGNIGMFGKATFTCWPGLDGLPFGKVSGIHAQHPDEMPGNTIGHHSFYVVWQRVTVGESTDPGPDPEPPEGCEEILAAAQHLVEVIDEQLPKIEEAMGEIQEARDELDALL